MYVYIKFGIKAFKQKMCSWNSLKREIASIKMLVVCQVFFFANSLFYRFRITLELFFVLFMLSIAWYNLQFIFLKKR